LTIPLLNYAPTTQNPRVVGYEVGGDEQPVVFTTANFPSPVSLDLLIEAAYRQIFFSAFKSDREPCLESQLRNGQITTRDFIRGLLLSETYKDSFYDKNSNYRFVELTVQKVLGRDVYSEREKIAWSIVVASKGIQGFVDQLLNSDEYLENFGDDTVPFQRRRIISDNAVGEIPFNIKSPRYDAYYRKILGFPQIIWQIQVRTYISQDKTPKAGDPSLFLDAARGLNLPPTNIPRVAATSLDYLSLVPRR
jgi:phycobilisome rod-core linker protein